MSPSISRFSQRPANSDQQVRSVEGLAEKAVNALGATLVSDFVATCSQEYRQPRTRTLHPVTKFEAIYAGHPDVGYEQVQIQ
jgi:hypothetical protein